MSPTQDELYEAAAREFGPALERLTCACERTPSERGELLHQIHIGAVAELRAV